METIPGRSYGDNFAGGISDFDLSEFVKRPTTICRLLSVLFAIVVFGCISAAGFDTAGQYCIFNRNSDACHYGNVIGIFAFLACLFFLAVDIQFRNISNVGMRKQLVMADLGFSGLWSFLWFVGFCFLADQWRKSSIMLSYQTNHARAAIAFSFFSIFTWVTLTLMAWQRYRQGDGFQYNAETSPHPNEYQDDFSSGGAPDFGKSPYDSFPQPSGGNSMPSYQQQQQPPPYTEQPFGVPQTHVPVATEYSVPNY